MKYLIFVGLIISIMILLSCKKKATISLEEMNPNKLKKEVIANGNVSSYNLLCMFYGDKKMDNDFLDISILMYEKYNYTKALSNIYFAIIYKHNPNMLFLNGNKAELFKKVPKEEQEIALKYLKIGVSKEDYQSIESLSEYYLSVGEKDKSKELLILQQDLLESHRKKVNDSLSKIPDGAELHSVPTKK